MIDKILDFLWFALAAIIAAIWKEVREMKKDLSKTREDMSTRTEHLALAAIVANTRETRMTREEMMLAIKDFKQDTDGRLDKIAEKMESTQQKLVDAESRTSQFRHDMRDQLHAQSMHIRLLAQKEGIEILSNENRDG